MPPKAKKMPKIKGKRKKVGGKKKKKSKKGGKKSSKYSKQPPLHLLTELFKKYETSLDKLYQLRRLARKRRLEIREWNAQRVENKHEYMLHEMHIESEIDVWENAVRRLEEVVAAQEKLIQEKLDELNDIKSKLHDFMQNSIEKNALLQEMPETIEIQELLRRLNQLVEEYKEEERQWDFKTRCLINKFLADRERMKLLLEKHGEKFFRTSMYDSEIMPLLTEKIRMTIDEVKFFETFLPYLSRASEDLAKRKVKVLELNQDLNTKITYNNTNWMINKLLENREKVRKERRLHKERKVQKTKISPWEENDTSKLVNLIIDNCLRPHPRIKRITAKPPPSSVWSLDTILKEGDIRFKKDSSYILPYLTSKEELHVLKEFGKMLSPNYDARKQLNTSNFTDELRQQLLQTPNMALSAELIDFFLSGTNKRVIKTDDDTGQLTHSQQLVNAYEEPMDCRKTPSKTQSHLGIQRKESFWSRIVFSVAHSETETKIPENESKSNVRNERKSSEDDAIKHDKVTKTIEKKEYIKKASQKNLH